MFCMEAQIDLKIMVPNRMYKRLYIVGEINFTPSSLYAQLLSYFNDELVVYI